MTNSEVKVTGYVRSLFQNILHAAFQICLHFRICISEKVKQCFFYWMCVQIKRTTLVDSRTSVTDVKFAPKHMGLMLTTCSADGVVRIYEAPDVMNLSQWSLQHEISCKLSCSCISWNPSRSHHNSYTSASQLVWLWHPHFAIVIKPRPPFIYIRTVYICTVMV